MKEKIVMFIIGALVGAIITTGVFLVIRQNDTSSISGGPGSMQMQGGPNGENGEPPELPNGEKPGEKPSEELDKSQSDNSTKTNEKENTTTNESNT